MYEIPSDRLPPGFADTVQDPPERPATPRPAATTVLLRSGSSGLEALLMQRHRSSGFVPGAWVFPGGRVDPADSAPPLYERVRGLPGDAVPDSAFWTAGLRELFEETGVLLARNEDDEWAADASSSRTVERLRQALMADEIGIMDVLEELGLTLDASGVVHMAHWVTPVVEPRRYDTHFFAALLPDGRTAVPDPREMTGAVWLRPADALERFSRGDLPMVFPTVKTLETLRGYDAPEHVIDEYRSRRIRRILPRLVRTDAGVAIVVDD